MNSNNQASPVRPFPWKCPNCGKKAVRLEIVSYPVEVHHDGRLHQFTVDGLKTPKCQECGEVFPDAEADRQISQAFRLRAKLLTPQQIRANREALALTQEQFASALHVAEATVSRWETGAQIQEGSQDGLMRVFFAMPEARKLLMDQDELPKLGATVVLGSSN
jgi:putative zinc finger/helix-turn-helix YgiT family protein